MSLNNVVGCDKCGYLRFGFPMSADGVSAALDCPRCKDKPARPAWWQNPKGAAEAFKRAMETRAKRGERTIDAGGDVA